MQALSSNSQFLLLKLARESIQYYLEKHAVLSFETLVEEIKQPQACFITLRKQGMLRGCVGTFETVRPLYENIIRLAIASAFEDSRFPPVQRQELPELLIEISVLGELIKMNSIEELEVGRHGVLVKYQQRTGIYLPEVAVDQGWSREEFLNHCAYEKARFTSEEFKRAEVYLYEVQKFSEKASTNLLGTNQLGE